MKKRYIYLLTLGLFLTATGFIVFRFNREEKKKQDAIYTLQPRSGAAADLEEWNVLKKRVGVLLQAIINNPEDIKAKNALAALYIQEARTTGNYVYYDKAALKYANDVLQKDSSNFEAGIFKAIIYLSQHHFSDGLLVAEKIQHANPYNAFVYGILVDGNVEMGHYKEAVDNSDKMVSIRPDIRSYSRISYLREIHGDYSGAIEAMKLAIGAGIPGDETTEWCRVQLGKLYEATGNLQQAAMNYTISLESRPHYAQATAGLARLAAAQRDYPKAITFYLQADSSYTGYAFREELAAVYRLSGQKEKADAIIKEIIAGMNKEAETGNTDESIGHYADQELAYAYLQVNDHEKALYHALQEYNRRPENIDVNETLAWVYHCKGDYAKAKTHITVALKTNSKNPRLLCRAGLIYAKNNNLAEAVPLLHEALKNNPVMDESLKMQAQQLINDL